MTPCRARERGLLRSRSRSSFRLRDSLSAASSTICTSSCYQACPQPLSCRLQRLVAVLHLRCRPPPAVAHVLSRITIPGTEVELDYVSVDKSAAIVKAFPDLGWKDSSAVTANTVAVPLLSLAGVVCLR